MIVVYIKRTRVLEILVRRNMTQAALAAEMSTTTDYFSKMMRNHRPASPRVRKKMMGVLGLKVDQWGEVFRVR